MYRSLIHILNRTGLLEADDEVWLAPAGTKDFAEGPTMTKAAGNEKTIRVPTAVSYTHLAGKVLIAWKAPMALSG